MINRNLFLLVMGFFLLTTAFSQKATVNGYISDKKTGERLFGASVFVVNKNLGTTSNTFGFYSLTLPQDAVELVFSFTGYAPVIRQIPLFHDTTINIEMETGGQLSEVV